MEIARDRPSISDTNLAPVIQIVAWLLLGLVLLSMGTRVIMVWVSPVRGFGVDDCFAAAATLFCVAQTICILLASSAGLGQSDQNAGRNQLAYALKLEYGADMLYIACLWASKISIVLFLLVVTPVRSHQKMLQATGTLVTLWLVVGLFGTGLQCTPPDSWDYVNGPCFHRLAFLQFVTVFNILTEVLLIVFPILITMPLKTSAARRLNVMVCFGIRIINVGAMIGQLVEIPAFVQAPDPVLRAWSYQVCVQCVQASSIITACFPYLRPFIGSLRAGALRADDANMHRLNEPCDAAPSNATRRAHLESHHEARLYESRKGQRDGSIGGTEIGSIVPSRI